MTYLDRIIEIKRKLEGEIHHSKIISKDVIEEYNSIVTDIMYGGKKDWEDEYDI